MYRNEISYQFLIVVFVSAHVHGFLQSMLFVQRTWSFSGECSGVVSIVEVHVLKHCHLESYKLTGMKK